MAAKKPELKRKWDGREKRGRGKKEREKEEKGRKRGG